MLKKICRLWLQSAGWKIKNPLPPEIKQAIIVVAPHTSNWDFIYGMGACDLLELNIRFAIKQEWVRFPLRKLFLSLGALPIERKTGHTKKRSGMTKKMIELFSDKQQPLMLLVTPEGSRSRVSRWHTGFYHIARQAHVPIVVAYLDYARKEVGMGPIFFASEDMQQDMRKILDFCNTITPKYPEQYQAL
ncbi:1-acyl-sn-glycerol-3-phosphate acyltransferase [Candidatus Venteria ishoeyi]|uniref:Acyltransferase n=1 Tax=Candidatus Venteria ishoeyi TaxID=1899563 RepID=A0A1H6F385_9GAMM|nr:1-acyl-sn-glycerol-3-phosphate acyltransferase [Candidatus Venteria ishoeyi]SEH04628.1 Acyltransferase [Candidatus Venteria ishoeyi]